MCGIIAMLDLENSKSNLDTMEKMSRSLTHRGPDDCGYAFFELFGDQRTLEYKEMINGAQLEMFRGLLAFGHRRLSIIDLTEAGHQPMCNESGNIWVIYNGELYNYKELTEELCKKSHIFKSRTDTEVILHAYEEWGTECLCHFNGMWAFALWDRERKRLFCARDRFGIKPFYYYFKGQKFLLASEIKAILQDPKIKRSPNHNRVYDYLAYGYLDHTEETFFKNINQLRGSHYLTLDIRGEDLILDIRRYWDLTSIEPETSYGLSYRLEERFLELFEDSIRLHVRSDVPVGTCLSGGLDSSSIVCVAKRFLNSNVHKTFSSCFEDKKYDERDYVNKVVEAAGTDPYYVFPKAEDLLAEIEDLIWYQDEPFGSTSIYAQWSVFKLAKLNKIKVILDGQGADELLAGYHPYFGFYLSELARTYRFQEFIQEYRKIRSLYPYSHSWILGHLLVCLSPLAWSRIIRNQVLLQRNRWLNVNNHSVKEVEFQQKFKSIFFDRLYQSLMNLTLPGLLHYEDRNSMAHSLEARVPFLDYRLVEFIFSLPMNQIIRNGTTKVILRETMKDIIPETVRTRLDKMGFVTPEDVWFREVLRGQVLEILDSRSFAERGYFDVEEAKKTFDRHYRGEINLRSTVWRWVNLELWFRIFIDRRNLGLVS
jgi:asparagine synthase (glutamine-hydrolysing)